MNDDENSHKTKTLFQELKRGKYAYPVSQEKVLIQELITTFPKNWGKGCKANILKTVIENKYNFLKVLFGEL